MIRCTYSQFAGGIYYTIFKLLFAYLSEKMQSVANSKNKAQTSKQ